MYAGDEFYPDEITSGDAWRDDAPVAGALDDIPAEVRIFAETEKEAQEIADALNRAKDTGYRGKFVAGSYTVGHVPGRLPAVVGVLR